MALSKSPFRADIAPLLVVSPGRSFIVASRKVGLETPGLGLSVGIFGTYLPRIKGISSSGNPSYFPITQLDLLGPPQGKLRTQTLEPKTLNPLPKKPFVVFIQT